MGSQESQDYTSFFHDKVIFLTGATGNLGSCTLFKLVSQLGVRRVYAFVRGSRDQAIAKIQRKMPAQAKALIDGGRVRFIVGDICLPGFGIDQSDLKELEDEVNIVIHAAANLSLLDRIGECVKNNCDPVLELARMALGFRRLQRFVSVSSVYANSFLPDGAVKEKIYPLEDDSGEDIDPELEREDIARTDYSPYTKRFAWAYALSKYLGERLLLARYSSLPLLVVRSSTIGPAMRTPFPLFGEGESLPIQHAAKICLRDPQASGIWHAPANSSSGTNILDETPVDWVANILLLHIAAEGHGIVHASAATYMQQTANEVLTVMANSKAVSDKGPVVFKWIAPDAGPQCALANLFVIGNRDWDFSCSKSAAFKDVEAPLAIRVTPEEVRTFNDLRYLKLLEELRAESSSWSE